jgi:threonyl-tRNA synthetase
MKTLSIFYFSYSLTAKCLVAEVNGELWDLCRPLEGSCKIKLLTWEDEKVVI